MYTTDIPPDYPHATIQNAWIVWAHGDTGKHDLVGTAMKNLSDHARCGGANAIVGVKVSTYSEFGHVVVLGTAVIWVR